MATVDEQLAQVDNILEQYTTKLGLPTKGIDNEVSRYITLSDTDIRKMSAEDCGVAAYTLVRAAYFLQLELNRHTARLSWAQRNIDFKVSSRLDQYGQYVPHEQKKILAIKDDDYTKKLNEVIVQTQARVDTITYLPAQLRGMADKLEEIGRTKRSTK